MIIKYGRSNLPYFLCSVQSDQPLPYLTSIAKITMIKPPFYYSVAICLAMPLYRYMVYKKSHRLSSHEREIDERFGKAYLPIPTTKSRTDNASHVPTSPPHRKGLIWCHAVSLGELNTAYPLLTILLNQGFDLWITSTTQTGFDRVATLFQDEMGVRVNHSFVPVDSPKVFKRFLAHVQPMMAVFIETELWANMLYELRRQGILAVLVNARLTEKSFLGYARFGRLSRSMMANLTAIIAQDDASVERFIGLGADANKVHVANSLKWASVVRLSKDNERLLAQVRAWDFGNRPIWLAASTHEGEENFMLEAQHILRQSDQNPLLILVPRHPERFESVASLCQASGLTTHRRSKNEQIDTSTQVYLADSMGELLAWYAMCDVAVVAGSFVDVGGHNPIEPASFAKPVVMGKFVKNCELLVRQLSSVNALVQADSSPDAIAQTVRSWLFDDKLAKQAGEQGAAVVAKKQKAAQVQAEYLLSYL